MEYVLRWELCVRCKDAVAEAFSVESILASWAAVGAVPFTMKCLSDDNVRHNGNDVNDPEYNKYQIIQSKNDFSCTQLSTMGYDADLLKTGFNEDRIRAAAAEEELDLSVTVANTRERQKALAKATTHGKKFYVTGGEHITSDDMFIAAEMGNRKREIAEMEKEFNNQLQNTLYNMEVIQKNDIKNELMSIQNNLEKETAQLNEKKEKTETLIRIVEDLVKKLSVDGANITTDCKAILALAGFAGII